MNNPHNLVICNLRSVPSSYGLKDTMFKLITQREYNSDEDAIENVDVYSKERKCKAENESSSMENQSIVHKPLRNVGNHTTVSNDDAGGTKMKFHVILFFV